MSTFGSNIAAVLDSRDFCVRTVVTKDPLEKLSRIYHLNSIQCLLEERFYCSFYNKEENKMKRALLPVGSELSNPGCKAVTFCHLSRYHYHRSTHLATDALEVAGPTFTFKDLQKFSIHQYSLTKVPNASIVQASTAVSHCVITKRILNSTYS